MEELNKTIDNGETEVQIATIGEVVGAASDGSPVDQKLTEHALMKLAEKHKDDEILVDQDHESEIGGKTEAKGWLSGLKFVPGKGLFGKIHWTDIGKKLIENRVFRWLSPSWYLDKNTHEPIEMTSVALTNKPSQAGRIEPIVNSQPIELTDNKEEYEMTMTKEELVSLIKETIAGMNPEKTKVNEAEQVSEKTEDTEKVSKMVAEDACSDDKVEKPVEKAEQVSNGCGDKNTEAKNAEDTEQVTDEVKKEVKEEIQEGKAEGKTEEEIKEEVKEEIDEEKEDKKDAEQVSKKEDEEEEEVIKIEALNSTPKTFGLDVVKNTGVGHRKLEYPEQGYAIVTKVN